MSYLPKYWGSVEKNYINYSNSKVILYYMDLDYENNIYILTKNINTTFSNHVETLIMLSLFADHIIIPSSSIPFLFNSHQNRLCDKIIIDMFKYNILISPIYDKMNNIGDYFFLKEKNGSIFEQSSIIKNNKLLEDLSLNTNTLYREPSSQSNYFQQDLIMSYSDQLDNLYLKDNLFSYINQNSGFLSRDKLIANMKQFKIKNSDTNILKSFYIMNSVYYDASSQFYDASLVTNNLNNLNLIKYSSNIDIQIFYKKKYLEQFLIKSKNNINYNNITIEHILNIRNQTIFKDFTKSYFKNISILQLSIINNISNENISKKYDKYILSKILYSDLLPLEIKVYRAISFLEKYFSYVSIDKFNIDLYGYLFNLFVLQKPFSRILKTIMINDDFIFLEQSNNLTKFLPK